MIQIDTVKEIVVKASALMSLDGVDIHQKDGYENIVTSADVAVQDYLCCELSKALPGSRFLCEEDDIQNMSALSAEDGQNESVYTWIIDPIDGTANFSRNIDQCAICVGLKKDSEMIMGVVYLPRTNEMFWAEKGRGAYLNDKQIHVSDKPFGNAILSTALPVYHKEYADVCSQIILEAFKECNDIRRFGACAPEICYLAMGRTELYFEYLLSPWDFAAASLILTEAGGVVCDLSSKTPDYVHPSGLLAANSQVNLDFLASIVTKYTAKTK